MKKIKILYNPTIQRTLNPNSGESFLFNILLFAPFSHAISYETSYFKIHDKISHHKPDED